jgi:hypothetical protein
MKENFVKVKIGNKVVSRRLYAAKNEEGGIIGKVRNGWGKMTTVSKKGRQKVFQVTE